MGFIKEPKAVDFIIKSEPLTDKDRKEISKFIADYKSKHKATTNQKKGETNNLKESRTPNIGYVPGGKFVPACSEL